jgi:serine/threonine protein kinase
MNIIIKGKGSETLEKRNYLSSGGEGSIYVKDKTAYKIYIDKHKVIPENKIKELSVLTSPNIIKPERLILDKNNNAIGYTMKYIKDTIALCQIFTKAFKLRNNIQTKDIVALVTQFRDTVKHCHDNNILIVDLNELNFLMDSTKFKNIYFIDVDSYQTPLYSATALMESIRDRHATKWSTYTDWFSFGIITFQMFTGIHPYKGKHAKYSTLDERMQNNISVFNKNVGIPLTTLPFTDIPEMFKNWYEAIFEKGVRIDPPFGDIFAKIIVAKITTINNTDSFIFTKIKTFTEDIVQYINSEQVITTKGFYIQNKCDEKVASYCQVCLTPQLQHTITAIIKDQQLNLYDVNNGINIKVDMLAEKIMSYDNRLYLKLKDHIYELNFMEKFFNKYFTFISFNSKCF